MSETQVRVLLIEDNPDDLFLIEAMIQEQEQAGLGLQQIVLSSEACLKDGLEHLQREAEDVVLLDFGLPESTGIETLHRFRQAAPDIAVIVLTGNDDDEIALQAVRSGAEDYLVKTGLTPDTLQRSIHYARERQVNRMALLESERRLATLLDNLPGMAYRCKNQPDWMMEFVNEGCKPLTGYEPQQLIGNAEISFAEIIDPLDRQYVWDHVQESQADQHPYQLQYRINTAAGEQKWVWEQGQFVYGDDGQVLALEGFITDITERVQARQAIEESEQRYRRLVENLDDLIYRYEILPDRRFVYVSPSATRITGYTPEEHYADPDLRFKLMHPDDRHLLDEMDQIADGSNKPLVLRWIKKDGSLAWTEQRNIPVRDGQGRLIALEGIARDITEEVRAREALRESEELQLAMIACSPLAIFSIDLEGKILFWTEAAERMFGWSAEEVTGKLLPIIPPGREAEFADHRRRAAAGELLFGLELVRQRKDGSLLDVSLSTALIREASGAPYGVMSIMEDISHRKKTEAARRESEERYRLLAETTRDIIILHDMQGSILYVNQAGLDFAGYEPGEAIGKSLDEFIPQEHQPEVFARRKQRAEGDQKAYRYEIEFINRKGTRVPVEINSTPVVQNESVYAILIVARDITERKRAEQEIRHKLAQLRALNEIDRAISSTLDPDRMFEVILHEIKRIVRCDSMSLQILRDGQLKIVASQGFDLTEKVLQLVIPIDPKFPNYRVIREGIPIGLEDVSREYPHFIEEASRFDSGHIHSWLGVPLIAGDKTIGMLTFDRNDVDPFNPDEVEVATLFAAQAAIALNNAQLYKTLEESEAGFRNIFEGIQDAIFVEDLDGAIVDVNERACELYGYSKETLLTMNARDLVSGDSPVLLLSELPNPDASPSPMETINQRADGKQIPVEITLRRGEIGGKQVQLVVVRDISERKRSEDQIQNQVNRLEALRQIDLAIVGLADLETTLRIFLEQLTAQLEVDAACILLQDEVSGRLEFASSLGFRTKALQYTSLAEGEGNAGLAAATQKPIFIQDLELKDTNFHSSPEFAAEGFQSYYAVPLIIREEVMGVIEIFHHSRLEPALEWIHFLDMLTTQAAIAIDNASLFTKLKHYNLDLERAVEDATRELIQTNKRLEAIINNSPDTVLLLTPQGVIELANTAIREQFDYDPGEIVGRHIDTLVQADARMDLSTPFEELLHSVSPAFREGTATRKDGTGFDAEMFFAPIRMDMNVFGFVCTIRDISEWKELGRMKDAFVSNVSHELRTPITSLRLNHSLMTKNPENQDKYLDRFDREIDRLSQLIEDLLRLSRLDQGQIQLKLEPVDLEQIIAEIVQDRSPLAETRQLEIEIVPGPASPAVQADANMIGQVLSVLLTNAIHYTPPGGHIKVRRVQGELEDFSWAGFSVEDDGPGVDPEDITHLFERFYRGKVGRESGSPGTGLGLAIANEILRRHNGQLHVESAGVSGQGTTFTVRLPVADDSGEMKK